ncbi:MAG TPA: hypothetical protein VLT86_06465 [Vicinamibacterales bacterium]|nr:hypothetical protein [Vicinamibacterales bacterium]
MPTVQNADRRGGIAGLLFLALLVVQAVLMGEPPSPNAPAETIGAWMTDHRTQVLTGSYLIVFATAFFIVFVVGLCRRLETAGGDSDVTMVARLAALLNGSVYLALSAVQVGMFYLVPHGDANVVRTLNAVVFVGGNLACIPSALFLLAIGWAARGSSAPRWLSWASLILAPIQLAAAACVAQTGTFSPTGPVVMVGGLLLFFVWVLAASVLLLKRPAADGVATPAAGGRR